MAVGSDEVVVVFNLVLQKTARQPSVTTDSRHKTAGDGLIIDLSKQLCDDRVRESVCPLSDLQHTSRACYYI